MIVDCFIDDIIGSPKIGQNFVALSKFELEKRSKAQNVGNWTGYQKIKFQFHIQISKFWQVRNLRLPFHLYIYKSNIHSAYSVDHVCSVAVMLYLVKFCCCCVCMCVCATLFSINLNVQEAIRYLNLNLNSLQRG